MTIGFSLVLISIVGSLLTRSGEVAKVVETAETTTTTSTTVETTTTIETTTTSTVETTTTTTTIPTTLKKFENDLEELGHEVTYVERKEEKWQWGHYENYVLAVIKKTRLVPENGNIDFGRCWNISEDVDTVAQVYYPDSDFTITLIFSEWELKAKNKYIICVNTEGYCSDMYNLPEKYC